jgi:phosphatidylglycerol---prolipoprotein diacylglyceryl transferase
VRAFDGRTAHPSRPVYEGAGAEDEAGAARYTFPAMIDFTPNPIALSLGPIEIRWYGIAYVAAITAGTALCFYLARRRGLPTERIIDGLIIIAIAALIGGRAYHVIDQWAYYSGHLEQIFLPPYSGLGVYGGLFTGLLATIWYAWRHKMPFWAWGDVIVPCIFVAQFFGRWGNFFNQELYGPPTNLPWGIAIQCQYRVAEFQCPPAGTTPVDAHFAPLFLYEALLSLLGAAVLIFLWNRFTARGRLLIVGDVGLLYFVWYGIERSVLETLRSGWNWTFMGLATAQIVGLGGAAVAIVAILIRHRLAGRDPNWPGLATEPLATEPLAFEPSATEPAAEPPAAEPPAPEPTAAS